MRILRALCASSIVPTDAEQRQQRQAVILEILAAQPVLRQTELVQLLHQRGIECTQSSVSRDLRQLGIAKLDGGYRPVDDADTTDDADQVLLAGFVQRMETAGLNLVVVRTAEGAAQRVALFLDRTGWPEIVGTVSGDDTIFVATRDGPSQRRLLARLRARLDRDRGQPGVPA